MKSNFKDFLSKKRNIGFSILLGIALIYPPTVLSQSLLLTQFDYNPLLLNPANTGNYNGDWRVAGTFRNQTAGSSNAFRSAILNLDKQVYVFNQAVGVGMLFVNDNTGSGGISFNKVYASAAYNTILYKNSISAGLQIGFAFGAIDPFYNFNSLDGTFTAPSNEPGAFEKVSFLDVNIGFSAKRSLNRFTPEIGFALKHINSPSYSFIGDSEEKLKPKFSTYILVKADISDEIYLTPKLFITTDASPGISVFGSEAGYNLLSNRSSVRRIFGGIYAQSNYFNEFSDMSFQAGTTVGRLDIVANYNLPLNRGRSGTLGSFEISFIYTSISTVLNSYSIPCERY